MAKLTNRGRNMGERIRNEMKIPRLVYKLRYIPRNFEDEISIRRGECKPQENK
jgi:hypothetical protein